MASYKVGILGATGAVGEQMRIVLAERKFPISELRLFGSARSAGKVINYEGQDIVVQEASLEAFKGLDLLLGAADNPVAKQFLPEAAKMGIHVVDNSSAFRLDPDVPLVIPEVNPEDVKLSKGLIANPNCATIIGLTAVNSLHRHARIRRMVVSTYQAVSGAGKAGIDALEAEVKAANGQRAEGLSDRLQPDPADRRLQRNGLLLGRDEDAERRPQDAPRRDHPLRLHLRARAHHPLPLRGHHP